MIVVTGGAGFIGSNIIKGLNNAGEDKIIVVDNLSNPEKHLNLNSLSIEDYVDKNDFLKRLKNFREIKTIFHQGACSSTTEMDGKYMMSNNFEYSKILLNFSLENKINFIYASSGSVYGNGSKGFIEKREGEYPLNVYGFSKFAFDNYVRNILPVSESQVTGLRYFNVYGPQENHKKRMASVAFHFFKQLMETRKIKIFEGSKSFSRDFIYVLDIVKLNLFFYESKTNGIFNSGTGKARSFFEIANIMKNLNGEGEIEEVSFPDDLKGKYQEFTEADLINLRKAGYNNEFFSIEEGLSQYFDLLTKNDGFYI